MADNDLELSLKLNVESSELRQLEKDINTNYKLVKKYVGFIENAQKKLANLNPSDENFGFDRLTLATDINENIAEVHKLLQLLSTDFTTLNSIVEQLNNTGEMSASNYAKNLTTILEMLTALNNYGEQATQSQFTVNPDTGTFEFEDTTSNINDVNDALSLTNILIQDFLNAKTMVEDFGDSLKISISDGFHNLVTNVINGMNTIKTTMGTTFKNMKSGLGNIFANIGNTLMHPFTSSLKGLSSLGKATFAGLGALGSKALSGLGSLGSTAISGIGNAFTKLLSNFHPIQGSMQLLGKSAKTVGNAFTTFIKNRALSAFNSIKNAPKTFADKLKAGLKMIMKFGFGIRNLYFLFRKLRAGIKEGLGNLGEAFPEVKAQVNKLNGVFLALKNSVATIFQPVLAAIMPVVETIISVISSVAEKVASFVAILTGQKYIYKASEAASDYAKAADKASKTTKKANDRQLASFDEITKLNADKGSDSGGGSGAGSMFTKEELDPTDAISDFAQRVKTAFENQDWTLLGQLFGDKVNEAMDSIDWKKVGEKIGRGLNGAIQTAYSFLTTVDFSGFGAHIAEAVNSALEQIDFEAVGRLWAKKVLILPEIIMGLITNLDWKLVATKLSDGVKGALDEFGDFLDKYDWGDIGDAIITFVSNIDYAGIVKKAAKLLGKAIGAAGSVLGTIGKAILEGITSYFDKNIEDAGGNIIKGIANGIANAFGSGWTWVKNNIFTPIWEGIKSTFQIHSPSKKMEEIGGYLIDGLKNGVSGIWEKIKSIFTAIPDKIKAAVGTVTDWFGEKININVASNLIGDGWNTLKDLYKKASETVTKTFNTAGNAVSNWKGGISEVWGKASNAVTKTFNSAGNVVSNWTNSIKSVWNTVGNSVTKTFNSAGNVVSNWTNSIKDVWNKSSNTIAKTFNSAGNLVSDWKNKIKEIWEKKNASSVTKSFSFNVSSSMKTIWNALVGVAKGAFAGVAKVLGFNFDASAWDSWHRLPKLATGAVIPANKEFLAVLGDQKRGTNIEAPLDTIKQALREVQMESGASGGGTVEITLNVGPKKLYNWIVEYEKQQRLVLNG